MARILYLECSMGVSEEKLMGALSELTDQKILIRKLNALDPDKIHFTAEKTEYRGIRGTLIKAEETEHMPDLEDITGILSSLKISDAVRENTEKVMQLLAEAASGVYAEAKKKNLISGKTLFTIVGVCILMEMLHPEQVIVSPAALGSGTAEGIPVPSPLTAYLLRGIPTYAGEEKGECCTPAGAALLKIFGNRFEPMPVMTTEQIGCGMGTDSGILRAFLAETPQTGKVVELVCNLDDMTPEELGYAQEILFSEGALDVYTTSVYMKKNRPGWMFTCMCREKDKEKMIELIFRHTTTLGIRENISRRYALNRGISEISASWGTVRVKKSSGYNTVREKLEYEDLAAIARKTGLSVREVQERVLQESREDNK